MHQYAAPRFACVLARALLAAILLCLAQAAPASAQNDGTSPLAPVDASSPRATFNSFRIELEKAYRAWRLREHLGEVRSLADRVLRTLSLIHI